MLLLLLLPVAAEAASVWKLVGSWSGGAQTAPTSICTVLFVRPVRLVQPVRLSAACDACAACAACAVLLSGPERLGITLAVCLQVLSLCRSKLACFTVFYKFLKIILCVSMFFLVSCWFLSGRQSTPNRFLLYFAILFAQFELIC